MLRGRGRPPKEAREFKWSEVPIGASVTVDDHKGPWAFMRMCDNGLSVQVYGGQFGHTRSFAVTRVSVKLSEIVNADGSLIKSD